MGIPEAYFAMNLISAVATCKILNKLAFMGFFRISFEISRDYDLSKEETKQYVYLAASHL